MSKKRPTNQISEADIKLVTHSILSDPSPENLMNAVRKSIAARYEPILDCVDAGNYMKYLGYTGGTSKRSMQRLADGVLRNCSFRVGKKIFFFRERLSNFSITGTSWRRDFPR